MIKKLTLATFALSTLFLTAGKANAEQIVIGYQTGGQCWVDLGGGLSRAGHEKYAIVYDTETGERFSVYVGCE